MDIGENHAHLKARNRGLVLRCVCTHNGTSRIEISHRTGLAKMTVSHIVAELMEKNYVTEAAPKRNELVGRNPIALTVSPDAPKILGLLIARPGLTAVLCDWRMRVLKRETLPFAPPFDLAAMLYALIERFAADLPGVMAIGIASVGPLDAPERTILNPPNFFGIRDVAVGRLLEARFGKPVYLNNDANAAALVEKLFGAGRELENFLYVAISNGIGSGIVCDGRLYQNDSGLAGELGHVSIRFDGTICNCGNRGCLETYADVPNMERKLNEATGRQARFADYCRMDDPAVRKALFEMCDMLACALVGQVNMLNPQCVIIGHEGVFLPDEFLAYLEERINRGKLFKQFSKVRVLRSAFGNEAHLLGSAGLVLSKVFEGLAGF